MTLIKTSILTAISTIIKIFSGFVINKVVAIYIGPSGLAMIGQLQSFLNIIKIFANGATIQGVIKYTAEYKNRREDKIKLFSSSFAITILSSIVISIILFIFNQEFSELIFKTDGYKMVFNILSFTISLFALNTLLLSILNGEQEIKKYILINIISSIFSLFFTTLLVVKFHLMGALYALVLNQSVIFFITLIFVVKSSWFKIRYFTKGFDSKTTTKLGKYALMALTSALTIPISEIIIRNYIGSTIGWDSAGYWQGIKYISDMYLLVITTSLSVYYLPKLSEIEDRDELRREIFSGYKIIMPIVIIMAFGIYIFRDFIIEIAFSGKFVAMSELFLWQLIGDVFKIASWLLAYLMLAKAMTKIFIISEILFVTIWTVVAILGVKYYGIVGITYAFALNYFLYLIFMFLYFRKRI